MLLLLLACTPDSVSLGDKGDTSSDTADTQDTGDTGDTDSGETGETGPRTVVYEGSIAGSAQISPSGEPVTLSCEGTFRLEVASDGGAAGDATCQGRNDAFAGTLSGTVTAGELDGTFAYEGYGYSGDARLTATLTNTALDGLVAEQAEGIAMSLILQGSAR